MRFLCVCVGVEPRARLVFRRPSARSRPACLPMGPRSRLFPHTTRRPALPPLLPFSTHACDLTHHSHPRTFKKNEQKTTVIKAKPRIEANRVLVTGGAGFVGSHLCTFLVERGDHVRLLDGRCVCLDGAGRKGRGEEGAVGRPQLRGREERAHAGGRARARERCCCPRPIHPHHTHSPPFFFHAHTQHRSSASTTFSRGPRKTSPTCWTR